jgi:hypothetical protein
VAATCVDGLYCLVSLFPCLVRLSFFVGSPHLIPLVVFVLSHQ